MSRLWSPMREMMQLHARLGRALGDPLVRHWGAQRGRRERVMPPLDVGETTDAFLVRVDVPGLKKSEIAVTVNETTLEISAEMAPPASDEDQTVVRAERFRGRFKRLIPLPRQADLGSVTASLADGVLTVTVGKQSSSRAQTA